MIERLEAQKKLTANQWKLICTANIADLLDFCDCFLIGYVTAALTKEWQLPYWQGGAILLAAGLGAVPGAVVWGWLGDRIGRRTVFIWSAVTISLATGIMVFTPGPDGFVPGWLFLMFFRFFVGIGNAGIFTIDLPLVQEFMPAYKRGWVSALITTLLPLGPFGLALIMGAGDIIKPAAPNLVMLGPAFLYFASWYILGVIGFYAFGPETKGRTLEEMDDELAAPAARSAPARALAEIGRAHV